MKYILTSILAIFLSVQMVAQSPATPSSDEMEEAFDQAMKDFQKAMDTIDLNSIFSDNFGMILGDSTSSNMKGLFGEFDLSQLFGPDMQSQMQESLKMLDQLDMDEMQSLMEGIDMSQIESMFEGLNMQDMEGMFEGFDMKELEKMFEGMGDFQPKDPNSKDSEPADKKSKKMKKI